MFLSNDNIIDFFSRRFRYRTKAMVSKSCVLGLAALLLVSDAASMPPRDFDYNALSLREVGARNTKVFALFGFDIL